MIRRVYSSLKSFKEMEFHRTMNVVLADAERGSGSQQTRNGAGKSSLVEIVSYVLGSSVRKGSVFKAAALQAEEFGLVFDLAGRSVDASRPTARPNWIDVHGGSSGTWPLKPYTRPRGIEMGMSLADWKQVLASEMYGLTCDPDIDEPSFRSLLGYSVRRENAGGLDSYMKYWRSQRIGDQQISLSYLLGLDWRLACEWETVRRRKNHLEAYRAIKREGLLGGRVPDAANLRTQLVVLEDRLEKSRQSIAAFRVVPGYEDMESEANALSRQLRSLAQEESADQRLVADLAANLDPALVPSGDRVHEAYEELGLVLPELVKRRFEEVERFHASVVQNRRLALEGQLAETKERITGRKDETRRLDRRLSELLAALDGGGALSIFSQLQAEVSRIEARATELRQQLEAAEQFEGGKSEIELRKQQLYLQLRQENKENPRPIERAAVIFGEIADALYEEGGSLAIGESPTGPTFEVEMHASRSRGISKMALFAFDLTLARLAAERKTGPGFLIHDSHLFDGVDDRQKAIALNLAAAYSERFDFQYIATINSDDLPDQALLDFDLNPTVVHPVLTDKTETGGLFGTRFD